MSDRIPEMIATALTLVKGGENVAVYLMSEWRIQYGVA